MCTDCLFLSGTSRLLLAVALAAAVAACGASADDAASTGGPASTICPSGEDCDPVGDPRIRVEVLNAAGEPGLARRATAHLRDRGFDVVHFGNAREFGRDTTLVLARSLDESAAEQVARALGTGIVDSRPDTLLYLEVTVLLGRDWPPEDAPSGRRPAWLQRNRP